MGGGLYDRAAHDAITTTRAELPREQVFRASEMNPLMDPKGVKYRESCDSAAHPNSNAIIFVVDETGSMQRIPEYLAKTGLPPLMGMLYDAKLIEDPQLMLAAVGDAIHGNGCERSPLQVGQFESEAALMDKWLTAIHLEGIGGGNGGESYDLALYFAARHTKIDCYEKRGKKGYLFISGDEPHLRQVDREAVLRRIGDDLPANIPIADIVAEASEKYHCFFLVPDKRRAGQCERYWRDVLGDNVVVQDTEVDTAAVTAVLVGLTEGTIASVNDVEDVLVGLGCDAAQANRVRGTVEAYAAAIGRGGQSRPVQGTEQPDASDPKSKGKGKKRGRV